jgi:hypothetical protein
MAQKFIEPRPLTENLSDLDAETRKVLTTLVRGLGQAYFPHGIPGMGRDSLEESCLELLQRGWVKIWYESQQDRYTLACWNPESGQYIGIGD